MVVCPFYEPMVQIRAGIMESLPYGVCSYDNRVVDCRCKDYRLCGEYDVLIERKISKLSKGGLEEKVE